MKKNIIKIFLLVILLVTSGCISKKNEDVKEAEKVTIDKVIEDLINYKKKASKALVAEIVMTGIYLKNGVMYEYYSITKLEIMTFQERVKLYDSISDMPKDIYVVVENKIQDFLNYTTIEQLLTDGGNACEGIGVSTEVYNMENGQIICSDGNTLKKIEVEKAPLKLSYLIGESSMDLTGIVVKGTYIDGTKKTEEITMENITGFETATTGLKNIIVNISGRKSAFVINVAEKSLTDIAITTQPLKTNYYVGDSAINLTGLVVTGTYSNGTTSVQTVTTANVSGFTTTTTGVKTITVTVSGKTATFPITVEAVTLSSISITTQPSKTTYYAGESAINLTGIVVKGTYNNGTVKTETVTTTNISGFTTATTGTKTITVTVGGKSATFPITVIAVTLNSITITTQPSKTTYYTGDSVIDLTGIAVKGTYNNGTVKTETVTAANISGFTTATTGTKTITVTVGGKSATFPITVIAVTLNSITITTQPSKTTYYTGDSIIDLTGIVVKGTYNNGTVKTETVTAANISGFTIATTGTKTITVTVGGKSATFNITVKEAIVKALFTLTKNIDILKLKQYSAVFEVADTDIKTLVLTGNGGVSPGQINLSATSENISKIVMDSSVTQIVVKALDINGNQVGETKTVILN